MGAVSWCKPGASDATVADIIREKESRDAPESGASGAGAPGATSPSRSGRAPAPGADAPDLVHFGDYDGESYIENSAF